MKLDIGCGKSKHDGYYGVDIDPNSDADLIYDLNNTPWPFDDNQFSEVLASQVIEHVKSPINFINELCRITKPHGKIVIITPHYTSADSYGALDHLWHLSTKSFSSNDKFSSVVSVKLRSIWKPLQFLVNRFARVRGFWESYLSFICRATNITAELYPKKSTVCK